MDVAAAFDKVWYEGLMHKLKVILLEPFVDILRSYLSERLFRVRQDEYSELIELNAGVPQGRVLGPVRPVRLKWKEHMKKKSKELDLKYRQ